MHKHFKRLHRRECWSHGLCCVTGSRGHGDGGLESAWPQTVCAARVNRQIPSLGFPICKLRESDPEKSSLALGSGLLFSLCSHLSARAQFCLPLPFFGPLGLGTSSLQAASPGFSCGHRLDPATGRLQLEGKRTGEEGVKVPFLLRAVSL